MELRFVLEHAEAELAVARKMFYAGDRDRCEAILDDLGTYIRHARAEGYLAPPNIDVRPTDSSES